MLGVKMPGKNKLGKFWNEKARTQLLSGIVVALLALTAVTGFFVALPRQASANPAAYIYTEDFEDDTVGQFPSEDWYILDTSTSLGTYTFNVSDYNSVTWTKTLETDDIGADNRAEAYMNFTADGSTVTEADIEYFSIDILQNATTSGSTDIVFDLLNSTTSGSTRAYDAYNIVRIAFYDGQIQRKDATDWYSLVNPVTVGTWYNINLTMNYTTHEIRIVITHDATTDYDAWIPMVHNMESCTGVNIRTSSGYNSAVCYVDNITIGSNTQLYDSGGGSSLPSAPTGATATAYTKFDISLSGYDGNGRFNFSTFNTNDTAGDTTWSNSTTYGILKVTNAGVQQINLSWTKGTGATNTYIEWNTISSWSRGAGTLLYNSTGTSELWSWNASGYSSTYATASATAGNASVTNLTIHMEDGGTGTALLPKENITLYGNGTGTFASLGAFDATTGNITLTTTYAGLPLAIGDSLYFEFKSVLGPGAQPNGTYYDNNLSESLDCKVRAER